MKVNSTFKLEKINHRYFAFDGGTGNIFEISEILYEILLNRNEKLTEKFTVEEIENAEKGLLVAMNNGILSEQNLLLRTYQKIGGKNVHSLNTLFLNVAQKCNLKCSYCFGKGGSYGLQQEMMSIDTARRCVDYWLKNIEEKKQNIVVSFFGGEPLLNLEVIEFVVQYINSKKQSINGNVKYMITTNGTILNNSIIEMFIKNDFLVSVSLDGISKIHNKNRAFASGKGSMDLVAKNTKKLLAHISNLNCQITLRREDIPFLEEAVTVLWEMGVDKVYSNIVFDKNEIYQEKDYKELKFQTEILSDLMYQHLISGSKNIYGNIFDYMQNLHTRNYAINCFVWKEKIAAFASNGDAYSCYRLVGENDFLLGNVRQHDFTVFSKPFEKQKVAQCQNCYCQLYCGEGCPCENLVYNSDINIPAEEWCEKNKILFDISLRLYLKIKVNEPDLFRKLCKYWEENR